MNWFAPRSRAALTRSFARCGAHGDERQETVGRLPVMADPTQERPAIHPRHVPFRDNQVDARHPDSFRLAPHLMDQFKRVAAVGRPQHRADAERT